MPFVLDTNIAIDLRDGDRAKIDRVEALNDGVMISIITRIELENGVHRDPGLARVRRHRVDAILAALVTLPFGTDDADAYRAIVEVTGFSRRKTIDRMIAAQALVQRAALVTANADDFRDVPGLEIVVW